MMAAAALGWGMFSEIRPSSRKRNAWLAVSFAVHCVVLYFVVRPPRPIYVTPSEVAFGHGGTSTQMVFLSRRGLAEALDSSAQPEERRITLRAKAQKRPKPAAKPAAVANAQPVVTPTVAERAGTPYGSVMQGLATGHDVRPALPLVYPDPGILPWQVPSGVEGNVIVEVTIDAHGNVIETKVLQALGHGIEEKVIAALRNWRFRPAMMDGRAIPSQQDVYFHFPS
jgi:TonB family protein